MAITAVLAELSLNIGTKEKSMRIYAEVKNNVIVAIVDNWSGDSIPLPSQGGDMVDVSDYSPPAIIGQSITMRTFAAIKNGIVSNIFRWAETSLPTIPGYLMIDITSIFTVPAVGWLYSGNPPVFSAPPIPAPVPVTTATQYKVLQQFTTAELAAIYTAQTTNVQLQVWFEEFNVAQIITLTDPNFIAGINALETDHLIATGRAAQILTALATQ
jgi:hypothetical protein